MDKETLSNYGWIVIAVLVLVVMIALATPFGEYISNAVQSTTKGLFSTSQNALNSAGVPGLSIEDQEFNIPGETDETPAITVITFTIDGTTYEAEDGMTWDAWILSDYNTDKKTHYLGGFVGYNGGYHVTYEGLALVYDAPDDSNIIIANAVYELDPV